MNKSDRMAQEKGEILAMFVSFGSECFLSKNHIKEIAHGLELSKVNFIWVIRFPKGERVKIEEALPNEFFFIFYFLFFFKKVGEK